MATKFETKRWQLEEFGEIYNWLEEQINGFGRDYRRLDEMEQDTRWNSELHEYELLWEDEEKTVPKMVNKWGYVDIPEDELTEEAKAKREACRAVMAFLEKNI